MTDIYGQHATEEIKEEEQYEEVELYGIPALFSNGRILPENVPAGLYKYDLRGSDYDPGEPVTVEHMVRVNHAASVLTAIPIPIPERGFLRLGEELDFVGGMETAAEFIKEHESMDRKAAAEMMENAICFSNEEIVLLPDSFYDRFAIYQIAGDTDYKFMGMDFVKQQGWEVNAGDYSLVYGGAFTGQDTLEGIYERFNLNRPEDFSGHSLSVSDVVVVARNGEAKAFYVDRAGFEELPDFISQRMHMEDPEQITGLTVKGFYGTWHSIDMTDIQGERFFLLESDEYGNLVDNIAVNEEGELVAEDLCRGFDPVFHEALKKYFDGKGVAYEPDENSFEKEAAYWTDRQGGKYFAIQETEHGFDYTFYDAGYKEIDGGIYCDSDLTMEDAAYEILADEGLSLLDCKKVDYQELTDKAAEVGQEEIFQVQGAMEEKKGQETVAGEKPSLLQKLQDQQGKPKEQRQEKPGQKSHGEEKMKPSIMGKLAQMQGKVDCKQDDISHKVSRNHTER